MAPVALTPTRLLAIAGFAISCGALLLFLWSSFGGPVPFTPAGYRVTLPLVDAQRLAVAADVRVSGVPVGRVVKLERRAATTLATLEIDDRHAPLRADVRATVRTKTVLGESYVALTPGTPGRPALAEGATLPRGAVEPAVRLDEALGAFDAPTRRALQAYVDETARATAGRGADVSAALARLPSAVTSSAALAATLDAERDAIGRITRDGGTVLRALVGDDRTLDRLLAASADLLSATGARDRQLAATVRALPGFLAELDRTLEASRPLLADAGPVLNTLAPDAGRLGPSIEALDALAPDLEHVLRQTPALTTAAERGLPAAARLLTDLRPFLDVAELAGRDAAPAAAYAARYRTELASSIALGAAISEGTLPDDRGRPRNYLRVTGPVWPEGTPSERIRAPTNRYDAYPPPRWLDGLAKGLESFGCRHTANAFPVAVTGSAAPCRRRDAPFPRLQSRPPSRPKEDR